jgi:hypothetical protein
MAEIILKIKNNESVCKFCDLIEFALIMSFPFLVPLFVMYATTMS